MTASTKEEEKEKARRQVEVVSFERQSGRDPLIGKLSFAWTVITFISAIEERCLHRIVAMQHSVHLPFTFSRSPRRGLHNIVVLHNARETVVERSVR